MSIQASLKRMQDMEANMRDALRHHVAVGLPKDEVGAEIYGDGMTVFQVGAIHEYGTEDIPQRSWLRLPQDVKKKEIASFIERQFETFTKGRVDVEKSLGLIGAFATNVSKDAFTTEGYGKWPPLDPATISRKGSSRALIDTGTLRNAITWSVR